MSDVHRAEPGTIRTALAIVAGGTVVGMVLLWVFGDRRSEFEAWVEQSRSTRLPLLVGGMALLTVGPVLGMAVYLWRLGQRVIHARRYPPPDFRTVRDTPVVAGDLAVRRGRWIRTLATLLGIAGLLLGVMFWRFALIVR